MKLVKEELKKIYTYGIKYEIPLLSLIFPATVHL